MSVALSYYTDLDLTRDLRDLTDGCSIHLLKNDTTQETDPIGI